MTFSKVRFGLVLSVFALFGCDQPSQQQAPGQQQEQAKSEALFERITTAVPWPRGLIFVDGQLYSIARGRHRRAGGISASVQDHAGALFHIATSTAEAVVKGQAAGLAVQNNATLFAAPTAPPFKLWDGKTPPLEDLTLDRPYCGLAYDSVSKNLVTCGYSGVDLPESKFRKNASDSVLRYDLRNKRWFVVESHNETTVPVTELSHVVPNQYYPHHDPLRSAPPHGWLNGPDGAVFIQGYLYVVAKDNHRLVQYDWRAIQADPTAPAPQSRVVFGELITLGKQSRQVLGHSALAIHEGYLYVGFRTSSEVIRLPLKPDGDVIWPPTAELIAEFDPYSDKERGANIMDLAFNSRGELYVSTAGLGAVWKIGRPDPAHCFNGRQSGPHRPLVKLRELTDHPTANTGNIAFDAQDRLYICCGSKEAGAALNGVIYRFSEKS